MAKLKITNKDEEKRVQLINNIFDEKMLKLEEYKKYLEVARERDIAMRGNSVFRILDTREI